MHAAIGRPTGRTSVHAVWGLLLLVAILVPQARAEGPALALRLTGGDSAVYTLSDVIRIDFGTEAVLVVVSGSGEDVYATSELERIEFLFDVSHVEDVRDTAALVDAIHLFQNAPNPLSSQTQIRFELPHSGMVNLSIYAPDGRLMRDLVTEWLPAGRHEIPWDGRNAAGHRVSGGAYFYRLCAPGIEESRRMILLP